MQAVKRSWPGLLFMLLLYRSLAEMVRPNQTNYQYYVVQQMLLFLMVLMKWQEQFEGRSSRNEMLAVHK